MNATFERDGDLLYAAVVGRLDGETAPRLEQSLKSEIEDIERGIILDMGQVTYVSSAGLRLVLTTTKKLQGRGGTLVLHSMHDTVREVFVIGGFDRLVKIADTREAARRMLE